MNLLYYLLEANFYMTVFYVMYLLVLRNETFYQLNRAWLLGSSVLAFFIPLVQLDFLRPVRQAVQTLQLTPVNGQHQLVLAPTSNYAPHYNWYLIVYLLIAVVMLGSLLGKVAKLVRLSKSGVKHTNGTYKIIHTADQSAFSFFNYLFVGSGLASSETVMRHELVHIRQKHSYDVIYFELLRVICWFNPLVHMMENSLKELHEFIADKATADLEYGADRYTDFLVDSAYGLSINNLANTFFNKNQLKKRIMMLHKTPSGRSARLKYLLAVPLCGGLLCVSTFGFTKSYGWINIERSRPFQQHQVSVKTDEKVNNWENDYTNDKGYHIHEKITNTNGAEVKTVTITEKDGKKHAYVESQLSAADKKMLADKFGFTFAKTPVKPISITLAPPPPPAKVDFARPNPLPKTAKGYKYVETGYRIAGKSDYRVIIVEQNGEEKEFWRSKASTADIKLLNDKYGYVFPSGPIHAKMPPPPPAPPVAPNAKVQDQVKLPPPAAPGAPKAKIHDQVKLPPPPPAPPAIAADKIDVKTPPPPPPAKSKIDVAEPKTPPPPPPAPPKEASLSSMPDNGEIVLNGVKFSHQRPTNFIATNNRSLMIVDGKKVFVSGASPDKTVQVSAIDSTKLWNANNKKAIEKWGDDVKYGVMELHGNVLVTVK